MSSQAAGATVAASTWRLAGTGSSTAMRNHPEPRPPGGVLRNPADTDWRTFFHLRADVKRGYAGKSLKEITADSELSLD